MYYEPSWNPIMIQGIQQLAEGPAGDVLRDCYSTLEQVASYRLPPAIDRRLMWLSENKQSLGVSERDELLALVDFAEDRTLEKAQARATLLRLVELFPAIRTGRP